METDILSDKQYIAGMMNTEAPGGKGTMIEYVVLTTLGDCIKESFNYQFDLTSKKFGEINVKSSSRFNSLNGHEWAFGKRPTSYIPNYFICVGMNELYTEILHVWIIPGNSRLIGSHGIHVIDSPRGLKKVSKYEVNSTPYNEVFQSIDFTSFPEFCNTKNSSLIKSRSIAEDIKNGISITELENVYGKDCYPAFLKWIDENKLKKYVDLKTGIISIYSSERMLEITEDNYPVYNYNGGFLGCMMNGNLTHYYFMNPDDPDRPVPKVKRIRCVIRAYTETQNEITLGQVKKETGIDDPEPILKKLRGMGDIMEIRPNVFKYV